MHTPGEAVQSRYFTVVFLISVLLLGLLLWPFWQLLILAFLLAGIFRPIYNWLNKWVSPWLASSLTCVLVALIVFIPLTFCIGALSSEALSVYQLGRDSNMLLKLQQIIQNSKWITQGQEALQGFGINFQPSDITEIFSGLSKDAGLFIYSKASVWAANIMSFVFQFCFLILMIYFLLIDMDQLIRFITRLSPLPEEQNNLLLKKFLDISGVILVGNGISGVFQGVMGGIFFAVLGIKSPVLWAGVMGILAFLPIFGIGLVLLPASAILLLNGLPGQAAGTFVFYAVLSFTVEYLLKPKFVGNQVKMHTLLVFLAILGGMSVFGVLGIIYGPLIVTAFQTLSDIYLKEHDPTMQEQERQATSPVPVAASSTQE
ncbi:MAG: AI-2E family transporter [Candidatus Electrothrix sp. AW2]|jgi:predicted PurR-regulated permease PerM|nr:AI-2E family transporter [Candidatus Electrothrix sp. AX1]MCI5118711.1 AI-2E family transporter [Candidatus Electrothrix gigas]MCI5134070.1 AI-2E family transporter [Candidatus Electrothrix gigas]MCI5179564.1 AI-2E family transporter [Candidatus Electrothrix gigas]MCI5181822.1 AI-2E family transporter [Candidatus Electrothrix gigas]